MYAVDLWNNRLSSYCDSTKIPQLVAYSPSNSCKDLRSILDANLVYNAESPILSQVIDMR